MLSEDFDSNGGNDFGGTDWKYILTPIQTEVFNLVKTQSEPAAAVMLDTLLRDHNSRREIPLRSLNSVSNTAAPSGSDLFCGQVGYTNGSDKHSCRSATCCNSSVDVSKNAHAVTLKAHLKETYGSFLNESVIELVLSHIIARNATNAELGTEDLIHAILRALKSIRLDEGTADMLPIITAAEREASLMWLELKPSPPPQQWPGIRSALGALSCAELEMLVRSDDSIKSGYITRWGAQYSSLVDRHPEFSVSAGDKFAGGDWVANEPPGRNACTALFLHNAAMIPSLFQQLTYDFTAVRRHGSQKKSKIRSQVQQTPKNTAQQIKEAAYLRPLAKVIGFQCPSTCGQGQSCSSNISLKDANDVFTTFWEREGKTLSQIERRHKIVTILETAFFNGSFNFYIGRVTPGSVRFKMN